MATHAPVPPLKGLQEEIEIAKSIRAETLAFAEHLMPDELDRQDQLAIEHFLRVARTQRSARRWLDSLPFLENGVGAILAVAKYEFWLYKAGLQAELPLLQD